MNFQKWLDTFIEEKNIDREQVLEVEGPSGTNYIPVDCILQAIKSTTDREQSGIKINLIAIDFRNHNVLHYLRHLAQAIAQ